MFDKTELEIILEALYGELTYLEDAMAMKEDRDRVKAVIAKIENLWRNNDN